MKKLIKIALLSFICAFCVNFVNAKSVTKVNNNLKRTTINKAKKVDGACEIAVATNCGIRYTRVTCEDYRTWSQAAKKEFCVMVNNNSCPGQLVQ
jgi:hypothetical protein